MPIKVDWLDRNVTVTGFRVYRAETPIPDSPLPAPIAEVGPTVKTYTDNDVVRNKLYYYRIGTVVGTEETLSTNAAKAFVPDTGPGPTTLKRGDWKCGYFGRFPIGQLLSPPEMRQVCGYAGNAIDTATEWLKFAYNGRVLFFPDTPFGAGSAWSELYALGLVFGDIPSSQWSTNIKTTYGTIAQNKKIVREDWEFMVRLPRCRPLDQFTATEIDVSMFSGEYDNLLGLAFINRTLPATKPYINTNNFDDVLNNATYAITADQYNTTSFLARGQAQFDAQIAYGYGVNNATYTHWRPVLELVP